VDKDGEDLQEVLIESISNEENATVKLLPGYKHKFEDGDQVEIKEVTGMERKGDPSKSINGTVHTVKTINPFTFTIGDTRDFEPYKGNGLAKQIKTPKKLNFVVFQDAFLNLTSPPFDPNLIVADFEKMEHYKFSHICYHALRKFAETVAEVPLCWSSADAKDFWAIIKELGLELDPEEEKRLKRFAFLFSMSLEGSLPPLVAFIGGVAT